MRLKCTVLTNLWYASCAPRRRKKHERREEHAFLYLSHYIKCNTTHLLLEAPCDDDTAGPSDVDSDRNEFFESLSHAQLTRVRNQATCVRAYLKMIDRCHPEWAVDQYAAEVAGMMGVASGTTIQTQWWLMKGTYLWRYATAPYRRNQWISKDRCST